MFMMIFYFSRVSDLTYAKSVPDMFTYIRATTGAYIYILVLLEPTACGYEDLGVYKYTNFRQRQFL